MLNPDPSIGFEKIGFLRLWPGGRYLLPWLLLLAGSAILATTLDREWRTDVPELHDAELGEAVRLLERAQLQPMTEDESGLPLSPALRVQASSPAAGTRVWKQSPVLLRLTRSRQRMEAPELRGLSLDEARLRLRRTPYSLGRIRELPSSPPNARAAQASTPKILAQKPGPGTIDASGLIEVLVSGPLPTAEATANLSGHVPEGEAANSSGQPRIQP